MGSESSRTGRKSRVTVIPTGKALGAEIQGADLRTVDSNDFTIFVSNFLHSLPLPT